MTDCVIFTRYTTSEERDQGDCYMEEIKWERRHCSKISAGMVSLQAAALLCAFVFRLQIYRKTDFYWRSFLNGDVVQIFVQLLVCSGIILLAGCIPFLGGELGLLTGMFGGLAPTFIVVFRADPSAKAFGSVFLIIIVFLLSGTLAGNISGQLSTLCCEQLDRWLDKYLYEEESSFPDVRLPYKTVLRDLLGMYICMVIPCAGCAAALLAVLLS